MGGWAWQGGGSCKHGRWVGGAVSKAGQWAGGWGVCEWAGLPVQQVGGRGAEGGWSCEPSRVRAGGCVCAISHTGPLVYI